MGSHSVTCHPAEVTFLPFPQPCIFLPSRELGITQFAARLKDFCGCDVGYKSGSETQSVGPSSISYLETSRYRRIVALWCIGAGQQNSFDPPHSLSTTRVLCYGGSVAEWLACSTQAL